MEPLSILQKMALDNANVLDDHVIAHMHTPRFRSIETYFFEELKLDYKVHYFWRFFDNNTVNQCTEQCPRVVITVSILSSTDI